MIACYPPPEIADWIDETLGFIVRRGFRYFSADTLGEIRCWGLIWPPPWEE